MKANELMIGDWVMRKQCFGENANLITDVYRVDAITKENLYLREEDKGYISKYFNPEIVPIPLTAEILEKNGFVYDDLPMSQYFEQYGLQLYYGGNGFRINCGINVSLIIDSVHELQHALRLCGIEKEIEL